jgi:hypothetical protein
MGLSLTDKSKMGLKKKNSDEEKEKNTMATLYPDLND